jgi:GNAT superfamily N-acetyltransferase
MSTLKIVKFEGKKIGSIEYRMQNTLEGRSIYVDFFWLEDEYRGKGFFKVLFNTLIAVGKRKRIKIFYLIPTDDRVYEIYKKYGFVGDKKLMRYEVIKPSALRALGVDTV